MRILFLISFTLLLSGLKAQDLERHVVWKHKNGKPKVVVYVDPSSKEKLKEEIFYPSGQLDYVGHYKNGKEHGKWTYYWENGKLKSEEYYLRGLEHGIMFDYDENGKPVKRFEYNKGELVSETSL